MAIEDILSKLPKVFGTTPEVYRGLLDPAEAAALENRANIGGLLGFAGALAQGMSPQGYRRSAAQNILTALGAGYGAAGQTYESGLNQVSNVMKLAQAKRQISGLAAMKRANPDLAYLADVSPDEFVRQVAVRERAKMYGLTPTSVVPSPATSPAPSVAPSAAAPVVEPAPAAQPPVVEPAPAGLIASDGGGFMGGGYGSVGTAPPIQPAPAQVAPVSAPSAAVPSPAAPNVSGTVPFIAGISQQNKAEAARLRQSAAFAAMNGDTAIAEMQKEAADRLDPKEQIFFRDGKAWSSTRGLIADVSNNRVLKPNEAVDMGLDPKLGKWAVKDGIPTLVPNTGVSKEDQKQALIAGLPNQLAGVHPTLRNQADALIARAPAMDNTQIVSEVERILGSNSSILAELNPALQQAKKATAPNLTVTLTDPAKRAQALSENSSKYIQNKNVAESFEVATRFNNFVQAFNNPQAAGASDAVLIYSMAKMLDPGGAVQQGDIGTIAGQKSIPDKLKSIHQQFINSRTLSDAQREDLNAMAYSLMNVKRKSLEPVVKQYRNYATALQSPDPTADVQNPFDNVILPKERVVTINQKRAKVRLGNDGNYYYTDPKGKNYLYND